MSRILQTHLPTVVRRFSVSQVKQRGVRDKRFLQPKPHHQRIIKPVSKHTKKKLLQFFSFSFFLSSPHSLFLFFSPHRDILTLSLTRFISSALFFLSTPSIFHRNYERNHSPHYQRYAAHLLPRGVSLALRGRQRTL
jgi:hypothetical protein